MIRVALVDDDAGYRQNLKEHLERYAREHNTVFQIKEFSDGDEIIEKYTASYDMIFMDVVMDYMDGIQAAEHIRSMDGEVLIIFISNKPQFAWKGYGVEALDYLIKPVSYQDFTLRMDRAMERLRRRRPQYLMISVKGGVQKLNVQELYYVEVQDHDLVFHTASGNFSSKGTLSEIEQRLDLNSFFRCNKCYLVNLGQVQSLQGCDVVVGGDSLQVSRAKKKALMDALNNYLNEIG